MSFLPLLVQLVCGAICGPIVGAISSSINLGARRNIICGMLGGGMGGQMLQRFCDGDHGASDMQILLCSVVGGVFGGLLFVAIVGFIAGRIDQRPLRVSIAQNPVVPRWNIPFRLPFVGLDTVASGTGKP